MKILNDFFDKTINEKLIQAVLSGQRDKEGAGKVKIRPVELKGGVWYQASAFTGTKVLHTNYTREGICEYLEKALEGGFSQLQVQGQETDGTILVSRKGKMTVKTKVHRTSSSADAKTEEQQPARILAHNRVKRYILKEGISVPFLADLGVMTAQGKVIAARYDKFRQINRFLEYIEDILPELPKDREVTILDFGCGKSYLTFAMYYYLRELKGYDVNIIGLDLKTDVIEKCSRLAEAYGYEKLHFYQGDIADYEGVSAVDMVVTLHACDTATDFALSKAVEWGAGVILSVPCCQHELNRQIKNEMLAPILHYGILKERMAALITDGIRAQLLEEHGYETQILEFIDMEHTPKNLLIRAVKNHKHPRRTISGAMESDREKDAVRCQNAALAAAMEALHVAPTLEKLLNSQPASGQKEVSD